MISGIWENEYIKILGILDHCTEIKVLYDEIRRVKGYNEITKETCLPPLYSTLDKEIMDLKLILDKWAVNKSNLALERLERFREKAVEND